MATPERAGREPHPEICLPIFESVAGVRQRRTGTAEHRNALLGCWLISGDRDGPARGRPADHAGVPAPQPRADTLSTDRDGYSSGRCRVGGRGSSESDARVQDVWIRGAQARDGTETSIGREACDSRQCRRCCRMQECAGTWGASRRSRSESGARPPARPIDL
jgi:hypothetical protein